MPKKELFSGNVKKDKTAALMFDYNLLGAGYGDGDIRNVRSALSDSGKAAFLESYGDYDKTEKAVDDCLCVLVDRSPHIKKLPSPHGQRARWRG